MKFQLTTLVQTESEPVISAQAHIQTSTSIEELAFGWLTTTNRTLQFCKDDTIDAAWIVLKQDNTELAGAMIGETELRKILPKIRRISGFVRGGMHKPFSSQIASDFEDGSLIDEERMKAFECQLNMTYDGTISEEILSWRNALVFAFSFALSDGGEVTFTRYDETSVDGLFEEHDLSKLPHRALVHLSASYMSPVSNRGFFQTCSVIDLSKFSLTTNYAVKSIACGLTIN